MDISAHDCWSWSYNCKFIMKGDELECSFNDNIGRVNILDLSYLNKINY